MAIAADLEGILIALVALLLDLLAVDTGILVQLLVHIGLAWPAPLFQHLQSRRTSQSQVRVISLWDSFFCDAS